MVMSLSHAMALGRFGLRSVSGDSVIGKTATIVQWDGCMADVRNERGTCVILERCNQQKIFGAHSDPIDGFLVKSDTEDGRQFYPSSYLRVMQDGTVEIWI